MVAWIGTFGPGSGKVPAADAGRLASSGTAATPAASTARLVRAERVDGFM